MIYGFDIEVATGFEGEWRPEAPLGVTCAVLSDAQGQAGMVWYSAPDKNRMTQGACKKMLLHLVGMVKRGDTIVTWNGVNFDWPVLGIEADNEKLAAKLAMATIDPAYAMFKMRGFLIGLNAASKGMAVQGKMEEMDGKAAVQSWRHPLMRPLVMEYCRYDAMATAAVGEKLQETGSLKWVTQRETTSQQDMPFIAARHYYSMPMADQSWMKGDRPPIQVESVDGWVREALK